jgi:hypothetical protein
MSGLFINLSFIFDWLIIYTRQLNVLANQTTALSLGMFSVFIPKDLVSSPLIDWLKILPLT